MACSNETLLEKELKDLKHVFRKINGYPWWVINQVNRSIQESINKNKNSVCYPDTSVDLDISGPKGNAIIKTININLKRILHVYVKTRATYTGQKLVTKSRFTTQRKINTNMIFFITLHVQNQLVRRII